MKRFQYLLFFLILLLSGFLRLFDLNWDQGFHMHPDERAIVIFTLPLHLPNSLSQFLSPSSPWNPHFFAYGSFPLYFLHFAAGIAANFNPAFLQYDMMNLLGRGISASADLTTVALVFFLGKKLFGIGAGFFGALFYGMSVLAIQTSHFYAVDTQLTLFIFATLYLLVRFYEKPTRRKALGIGIIFGLALATKDSALALLSSVCIALFVDFLLIFLKNPRRPKIWGAHIPKAIRTLFTDGLLIALITGITFVVLEPYALIDFPNFWSQTMQQAAMTHDAFTFPYTLQYVGIIPFLYEIKNMFLWGIGPYLFMIELVGIILGVYFVYKKNKGEKWAQELILLAFLGSYFLVVGHFAIAFMRYMLPIYPLLALFGGLAISQLLESAPKLSAKILLTALISVFVLFWPITFMTIYLYPNTRVQATNWILSHVPPNSTIAVEHWDDSLPLTGQEKYTMVTLPLYDPDTSQKWAQINQTLAHTDYIVIASNRLYVPLQKLTNCNNLPALKCYPQTAAYYKRLFAGQLGFTKVAEFAVYPTIPFTNISLNDQIADESFTVYDHPKIMIFKKMP